MPTVLFNYQVTNAIFKMSLKASSVKCGTSQKFSQNTILRSRTRTLTDISGAGPGASEAGPGPLLTSQVELLVVSDFQVLFIVTNSFIFAVIRGPGSFFFMLVICLI